MYGENKHVLIFSTAQYLVTYIKCSHTALPLIVNSNRTFQFAKYLEVICTPSNYMQFNFKNFSNYEIQLNKCVFPQMDFN